MSLCREFVRVEDMASGGGGREYGKNHLNSSMSDAKPALDVSQLDWRECGSIRIDAGIIST